MALEEDDNGPPLEEGIPDDTPDEITSWVVANGVADNYTVMLKEFIEGSSKPAYVKSYTNRCPSILEIGKEWGPGKYQLVFSWRAASISGPKKQTTKAMDIELAERAWRDLYEDAQSEKRRDRNARKTREWEDEALKAKTLGAAQPQASSDFDSMKKMLSLAKELGVPIGGNVKQERPQKSFSEKLADMVPAITAIGAVVGPIAVALIERPKEKADATLTNTLLAHVLNKPKEESMTKDIVPFLMGSIKQIFELKESMEPQEKESMVEKIIGKLAPMIPAVISLAAQGRGAVESNPVVQSVREGKDFKTLAGDPEALILFVNKQDAAYGFQQTNQILMVGGINRPPETFGNMARYPSKGFKPDGTVDDGRDAKPADVKPGDEGAGEDDLVS